MVELEYTSGEPPTGKLKEEWDVSHPYLFEVGDLVYLKGGWSCVKNNIIGIIKTQHSMWWYYKKDGVLFERDKSYGIETIETNCGFPENYLSKTKWPDE